MTLTIALALAIVSIILFGIELIRSRGQNVLAWAGIVLAVAVTFSRL